MTHDVNMRDKPIPMDVAMSGMTPATIGHSLVRLGKLTPALVDRVLRVQQDLGLRFGEAARRLGLITEDDIRHVLALQFGYRCLAPGEGDYPSQLVVAYEPFSEQADVLRAIRMQLMLHWFSTGNRSLVVAAVDSDVRAGMLTANLGVLFAQLGENTLIVDANLRHPIQQDIFKLQGRHGLSDILVDRAGDNQISRIDSFPGLSVLPAGTSPPNPQELLCGKRFTEMVQSLENRYSVILYEAPSFSSGTDALGTALAVGAVLLVADKKHTRLAVLERAGRQLQEAGVKIVGSVMVND